MGQDNVQIVKDAYTAFGKGDIQFILNSLANNVKWITPGPPDIIPLAGERNGREEVAEFFSTLNELEDVLKFEPQEYIAQGNKVVTLIKYASRMKETGRTVETDICHIFTMRDGKVAVFQEFVDTALIVEALRPTAKSADAK